MTLRDDIRGCREDIIMDGDCVDGEAASEAELRQWAATKKLTSKAVDLLVKDGFNSLEAVALLDAGDFTQSKIPRGQQKLLLKAIDSLRPAAVVPAVGGVSDANSTSTAAHVVDGVASGSQRESAILTAGSATADEGGAGAHAPSGRPTHQHPVADGDVYSSMAVDHMRSMQATFADTRPSQVAADAHVSTRSTIVSGGGRIGQLLGEQGQAAPQLAGDSVTATWQDPQVYLMAASVGKSTLQYHDIADFINKDNVHEEVIAGADEGTQIVIKSGSKPKLDSITISQWSIANLAILYVLVGEGKLVGQAVLDYLAYTTKIYQLTQRYENTSVYFYDREYRKLQSCHGFRWGCDIPHLQTVQLIPRVLRNANGNDKRPKVPYGNGQPRQGAVGPQTVDGRPICKLFNTQRGCNYTDCRFMHVCSHRGCAQAHSVTAHYHPK